MIYENGEVYIGNWNENIRDGKGKYCYLDGSIYEGEWKNGVYHGFG